MRLTQHDRYRPSVIALHWLTLVLLVAVYASIELRGLFERGSDAREMMKTAHFLLGISVFALTWLRLVLRLGGRTPAIRPRPPGWQEALAKLMALALYALMLATPVLGYLMLNAAGKAPVLAGWEMPHFIGAQEALATQLKDWHETIASVGYWLIGLHALAGVYHHHIRHDDALVRMMPRR